MTLFASLGEKSTAQTSTCSLPTAIQLHSRHALDFINNKISTDNAAVTADPKNVKKHSHSLLSYQAVQTQQDDEERTHTQPDLGVWSCSLSKSFDADSLGGMLKNVVLRTANVASSEGDDEKQPSAETADAKSVEVCTNTVLMTINLEELNQVQPTLERMRNVTTNAYDQIDTSGGTTSIKTLQSCTFGSAQIKQEVSPKSVGGIALILAVIVPSSKAQGNASTEYQEKQKQSLVLYHLHKFALEVDCTLCFVRESADNAVSSEGGANQISTMTIAELAAVIHRVAMGLSPMDEELAPFGESKIENEQIESNKNEEIESSETKPTIEPPIYLPGSHDAELICGAMQRNASCEGLWDASKDDLAVALPESKISITESTNGKEPKGGDEEWLSKLASSVGLTVDTSTKNTTTNGDTDEAKTPVRKDALKKKKSSKAASSKSDKAPSDFFANLLKK